MRTDYKNFTWREAKQLMGTKGNKLPQDCNAVKKPWVKRLNEELVTESVWVSLINKFGMRVAAEVGVLNGGLMWKVMTGCKNIETYYAVDPWKVYVDWSDDIAMDKQDEFRKDPRSQHRFDQGWYDKMYEKVMVGVKKNEGKIKVIREESIKGAEKIEDNSLDGIYLDAIHDFPNMINDLWAWMPKVKKNGIVAGHDYYTRFLGLIRAVDFVFGDDFIIPVDRGGDNYSFNWYIELDGKRNKYMNRIKNKFPNPTELLVPENKYMHLEKDFMENLYA